MDKIREMEIKKGMKRQLDYILFFRDNCEKSICLNSESIRILYLFLNEYLYFKMKIKTLSQLMLNLKYGKIYALK